MKIEIHPSFKKAYKKRILNNPKLLLKMTQGIKLFQDNSNNPILNNHGLKGSKKSLKAFSITSDIRIVYLKVSEDHVILLNIGTHNQVY